MTETVTQSLATGIVPEHAPAGGLPGAEPSGSAPALRVQGVTAGYDGRAVLHDITCDIPDAGVTTIVGPNGCGKSTLLKTMGRLLAPSQGAVLLDGRPVHRRPTRGVARRMALLPQHPLAPDGVAVADLVARGRTPHQSYFRSWSRDDDRHVTAALEAVGLADRAGDPLASLSGGQRQRAWLAMVLAQDTGIVLLDEPTTFLDLAYQVEVLELVHRLHAELGRTVVMVLHDLSLAAQFSDRILALHEGRLVAEGAPHSVVTEELLAQVFGLRAGVIPHPVDGTPMVVPHRARGRHR